MNHYLKDFISYLEENSPNHQRQDSQSLLDMFGSYYLMCNPVDLEGAKTLPQTIEPIINSLSGIRKRRLLRAIRNICEEYERLSFQEGIRVGAMLILELLSSDYLAQTHGDAL